jgi:exodeoxyribonuclease VII small subunit
LSEKDIPSDIAAMGFEEALAALEEIVRRLEAGKVRLDEAVTAYARGTALRRHCETKLAEAKLLVERIAVGPDGTASIKSVDSGESVNLERSGG